MTWEISFAELIDEVIDWHKPFVVMMSEEEIDDLPEHLLDGRITEPKGVNVCHCLAARLRELAQQLDDAVGQAEVHEFPRTESVSNNGSNDE